MASAPRAQVRRPAALDMPEQRFLLARWLPATYAGRTTGWMPDDLRHARNVTLVSCVVEIIFTLASLPLGAIRGGLGRISLGMNIALLFIASMGIWGALRLSQLALYGHGALACGLVGIFALMFLFTVTLGSDGEGGDDTAIIYVVFVFFLVDVVAGVFTIRLSWWLGNYGNRCADQDDEVGGEGRGLFLDNDAVQVVQRVTRAVQAGAPPTPSQVADASAVAVASGGGAAEVEAQYLAYMAAVAAADSAAWQDLTTRGPAVDPKAAEAWTSAVTTPAVPLPAYPDHAGPSAGTANQCGICMDAQVDTLLYDCGHLCCAACAERVSDRWGHCPYCRKRILDTVAVYR